MSPTSFVPIPPGELGGVIAINIFATLSTLGLVLVALKITWLLIRRHLSATVSEGQELVFFNTQLGQFAACLLIAMVLSTTSGIIGMSWVVQRGITEGWVCRSQAALMQIATWGAGYFTVTISVHTFNALVLRRPQSAILCRSTMSIGWFIAILVGLIPFMIRRPDGYVYGADGLICGVRSIYPKLQFLFHLLPILIGSFLSAIIYSLIFLVLRGTLKIRDGIKFTLNPDERWNNCEEYYHRFVARVSRSMLWYPVAYIVLLVPYSIVRLLEISGFVVPFEATVFAFVCWFSLGIVDYLLIYNTFRVLSPAFDARSASTGTKKSTQSFRTLQRSEYSTPYAPSTSWAEKISQYRSTDLPSSRLVRQGLTVTPSKSFALVPVPLHLGSTTDMDRTNLSSPSIAPAFFTQPPSASLFSRSDMERHDRANSPILTANLPAPPRLPRFATTLHEPRQSLRIYDDKFLSSNEHVIIRQQSTQTFGHRDSSQGGIPSWALDAAEWTTSTPHSYISPSKTNEGQERLSVATSSVPDRSLLSASPPLSTPVPMYLRRPSHSSTTSSLDSRR